MTTFYKVLTVTLIILFWLSGYFVISFFKDDEPHIWCVVTNESLAIIYTPHEALVVTECNWRADSDSTTTISDTLLLDEKVMSELAVSLGSLSLSLEEPPIWDGMFEDDDWTAEEWQAAREASEAEFEALWK